MRRGRPCLAIMLLGAGNVVGRSTSVLSSSCSEKFYDNLDNATDLFEHAYEICNVALWLGMVFINAVTIRNGV